MLDPAYAPTCASAACSASSCGEVPEGGATSDRLPAFTATSWAESSRTFMQPGTSGHTDISCGTTTPPWPLSSRFFVSPLKTTLQ